MKILLIHKFHYMLGGTETFHYNLAEALTAAGHEVIFFSMYDERNIPCAQDKYFVSNVDYNDPNLSTFKKIKMGIKLIYSFVANTSKHEETHLKSCSPIFSPAKRLFPTRFISPNCTPFLFSSIIFS